MAARPRDTLEFSMGTVPNSAPGGAGNINDMMICPYDESHVVSGGKFHKHIYRCRQRQGGQNVALPGQMLICPYNSSHHVHESVMHQHTVICDDYYRHCMKTQAEPLSYEDQVQAVAYEPPPALDVFLDEEHQARAIGSEWGAAGSVSSQDKPNPLDSMKDDVWDWNRKCREYVESRMAESASEPDSSGNGEK